jgi:putative sterol carrier protein
MDAHELLARMPEIVDADRIEDVEAVIQYDIDRPLWHEITGGEVRVHEGRAEAPDLVVRAKDATLLDLFYGRANPMMAFMTGRVKVEGDMTLAQNLVALVDRERLQRLA